MIARPVLVPQVDVQDVVADPAQAALGADDGRLSDASTELVGSDVDEAVLDEAVAEGNREDGFATPSMESDQEPADLPELVPAEEPEPPDAQEPQAVVTGLAPDAVAEAVVTAPQNSEEEAYG